MRGKMKKIIMMVCGLIVVVFGCIFISEEYKVYKTVSCMATDEENAVITGIWDEDNLDKYKYLAIPDTMTAVNTFGASHLYKDVKEIGESAFEGNTYLESVYIPVNIVKIGKNAFNGCTSIKKVTYAGTVQEWDKIVMEPGNVVLKNVPIEYNAKMPRINDQ